MRTLLALTLLGTSALATEGAVEYRGDQRKGDPAQIEHGRDVYFKECAKCHVDVDMPKVNNAPRIVDGKWLSIVSNEFILRTATDGTHELRFTVPPTDLVAVMAYLRSRQDRNGKVLDDGPLKGDAVRGKTVFAKSCASCHGEHGFGQHEYAKAPPVGTPRFLKRASDGMIRAFVAGHADYASEDPAALVAATLPSGDVDAIIAFLRTNPDRPK